MNGFVNRRSPVQTRPSAPNSSARAAPLTTPSCATLRSLRRPPGPRRTRRRCPRGPRRRSGRTRGSRRSLGRAARRTSACTTGRSCGLLAPPICRPVCRQRVLGVFQAGLELANHLAEQPRREEPGPERTGRARADRRQLSQRRFHGRGHASQLPADLVGDGLRPIGLRECDRFGGVRGRTQRVRAHVRNRCGLRRRSDGRGCVWAQISSGASRNEPAANLLGDIELAARERSRSSNGVASTAVFGSFRFDETQHPLRTIGRPPGHDPPLGFAQRLRRQHAANVPRRARGNKRAVAWSLSRAAVPANGSSMSQMCRRLGPAIESATWSWMAGCVLPSRSMVQRSTAIA